MEISISDVIRSQMGKGFSEALYAIEAEYQLAGRMAQAKVKRVSRAASERHAELRRVLNWFHSCSKPDGIKEWHWSALSILAEDFVQRGILKQAALKAFK